MLTGLRWPAALLVLIVVAAGSIAVRLVVTPLQTVTVAGGALAIALADQAVRQGSSG